MAPVSCGLADGFKAQVLYPQVFKRMRYERKTVNKHYWAGTLVSGVFFSQRQNAKQASQIELI